jgi:hypothetical protein
MFSQLGNSLLPGLADKVQGVVSSNSLLPGLADKVDKVASSVAKVAPLGSVVGSVVGGLVSSYMSGDKTEEKKAEDEHKETKYLKSDGVFYKAVSALFCRVVLVAKFL